MANWLAKHIYKHLHREYYTPTRIKNRDILRQGASCERELTEVHRRMQEAEARMAHKERERQIAEQRDRIPKYN